MTLWVHLLALPIGRVWVLLVHLTIARVHLLHSSSVLTWSLSARGPITDRGELTDPGRVVLS